jgi:indolepyruvate ferredoxin oxidoreductase
MPGLEALIEDRSQRLAAYQDAAYAKRYEGFVREIAAAEKPLAGGDRLAREVAVSLYKLMAYKDEYEVARLYVETGFFHRVASQFEGDYKLRFHLAPPLFSRKDAQGHLLKQSYGPWIATAYQWLSKARRLRGTPLDIFGYTAERRGERAAIGEFEALMRQVVGTVTPERLDTALELARLPQSVRGFGHVKEHNAAAAQLRQQQLLAALAAPQAPASQLDRGLAATA